MHKIKFAIVGAAIGLALAAPAAAESESVQDFVNVTAIMQVAKDSGFTCIRSNAKNGYCFSKAASRVVVVSTERGLDTLVDALGAKSVCEFVSASVSKDNGVKYSDVQGTYLNRALVCGATVN